MDTKCFYIHNQPWQQHRHQPQDPHLKQFFHSTLSMDPPATCEQTATQQRPQATAPRAPPKPPYPMEPESPCIGSKRSFDASSSVSTFSTPSMNNWSPAIDTSLPFNAPAAKRQKRESISCRKMRQTEDCIAFLDEFKKNHRGKLPTYRGLMNACGCGFKTAKKLLIEYAEKCGITVKLDLYNITFVYFFVGGRN